MPLPAAVQARKDLEASKKTKQEDFSSLTVVELKKRLKAEGLSVTGKKDVLIERLSLPEIMKKIHKREKTEKVVTKKAPSKKVPDKKPTPKKASPKKKVSPEQKALEVYHKAVELMGPEKFIEETLVTMKAFQKGQI